MDKRFWGILAAIAILFGGIFFFTNSNKASAPDASGGTSNASTGLTSHIEGEGKSGVLLVEYGDYQCPACYQYFPIVEQVVETHKSDIKFQFRNFPLFQIHKNAMAGARAAEAADMQGKYWEMHDKLYQEQQSWSSMTNPETAFVQYASGMGLDAAKFKADFKSKAANSRIQADLAEGNRLGVNSTPTFFVDGKKISNPESLAAFNKVIDNAIEQKTGNKPAAATPTTAPTTSTEAAQ